MSRIIAYFALALLNEPILVNAAAFSSFDEIDLFEQRLADLPKDFSDSLAGAK